MKVLVTGSGGFLGSFLCRRLEAKGHQIAKFTSKEIDLTSSSALDAFAGERFDQIYHLAAWTQAGDFCLHHPGEQWIINQKINTNVLSWWQSHQAQAKIICMGTSCSYAPDSDLIEDNYLAGTPIDSLFTYAMTKRMLHAGLLALYRQYNLRYLTLVPSTLYGPSYHTDDRQMHFIFDLIRKILRGKELGEPVVLWGDGSQKREIIHVEDFITIGLELADRVDNDIVNVGAGEEFTILHFARKICEIVGFDPSRIEFDTSRYVGAKSKCLDTTKLRGLIEDIPMVRLHDGLESTIDWFRQNQSVFLRKKPWTRSLSE